MKTKNRILCILLSAIMVLAILPFSALTLFADTPEAEITEVATFGELLNAVNSDKTHIKLMDDIKNIVPDDELPTKHRLLFDGGKDYILDLNGNTLMVGNYANEFYTDNFSMIAVSNSSNLEIENGSIVFENWYTDYRTAKGVAFVTDDSTLTATDVDMYNGYTGTVVYATDDAKVTLDGGDYTAMSGFAVYLEKQASLTLDGGVWIGTKMGDSTATVYLDGYGALYSESTGEMVVNNAYFNTGIQVHESQVGAFSIATHELVINGIKQEEDVYFSDAGNQFAAIEASKDYYWYKNGYSRALYKIENPLFANAVRVISYEKKYSIDVQSGTATVGGNTTTEVGYGQTVTIVADPAENGMEFVRWDTSGVELADYYSASTTFTMPAAPVYIAAYYGKESVKSVSVTVGNIIVGEKSYDTEITLDGGVKLEKVEWYENLIKMEENDIFKPGKAYELKILVYPPDEHKFGDTVTATVNGKQATVNADSGYAIINYTFDTLAGNPFPVIYNISTAKLGIGGLLELDTALMCSQSNEFKTAFDADTVTYQWYKDGDAIEGATDAVYNFTADDVGCRFFVTVTVGDKTAWGDTHPCYNYLYQVYLNASDFVAGGKAPQISSATPGVSIDPESLFICEGKDQPELDIQKTVLIPGKTYLVIGTLVQMGEANIPYEANVYVNDILMDDKVDGTYRFFYKFTVPEADYPVYYKANGEIGIGVTLTVDVEKMCNESGTFKNAYEAANPTYQTVFYQWYKNGEVIKDETNSSYTVKTTDRDSYVNCKVTLVDGKYGIGEQQIITNVITVINVTMPIPKDGETRITSGIYADGVNLVGIMWWPQETGATMQGDDKYDEGTVYEYLISFEAKVTFALDFTGEMTVAYVNGVKIAGAGSGSGTARYMGEVTAIHTHQYSDSVWDSEEDGHWHPCIVPGCPDPNEEWEGYMFHYGSEATCQTKGKCSVCEYEYYGEHDVAVPNYVYIDDMRCGSYCATEGCDYLSEWSYHTGGTSDCQHKAICEICHHEYGDFAPCSGGVATHTAKAICATCGNEYGEVLQDGCSGLPESGQGATCTVDGWKDYYRCECGKYYEDANCQTPINDLAAWKVGAGKITAAHSGTPEWTKTATTHEKKYTCCDTFVVESEAHEWNNGTCSECEYVCLHTSVAVTKKDGQDETCTVDGWKDYYQCACGKYFADEARTTPIADLEAWKINDGRIAAEHKYGDLISEEGAVHTQTQLEAGMYAHYKCSVCQNYFDENKNPTTENALIIPAPQHSYGDWVKDNEKHWKVCSCGLKADEHTHNYTDNADMICNDCSYDRTVPHTCGNATKQNGQGATCTVNGWKDYYKCSCGKLYTEAACTNEITSFEEWKNGDGKIAAAHSYGDLIAKEDATCSQAGMQAHFECSVCHTLFDADKAVKTENELTIAIDANAHTYGVWTSGGDGTHTRVCSLNAEHKENGNCAGGTATCTEKAVCAICNTAYGNTVAHTDADTNGKCDTCGADVPVPPPAHTHDYGTTWKTDESEHWNECSCGDKANKTAHTDSNNDGKCDTCEYQMSTTPDNPDNPNNTPDNPNNTPDDPNEDKDGLGAGAIVGIVIGSATVAGVGGFALLWFVIKKKSFADLIAVFKK